MVTLKFVCPTMPPPIWVGIYFHQWCGGCFRRPFLETPRCCLPPRARWSTFSVPIDRPSRTYQRRIETNNIKVSEIQA